MTKKGINLVEFFAKYPELRAGAIGRTGKRFERPIIPIIVDAQEEMEQPPAVQEAKVQPEQPKAVEKEALRVQVNATNNTKLRDERFRFIDPSAVHEKDILLDFIYWNALPKRKRVPKTRGEFSEKCGIDAGTLSRWKRLAGFWDEVSVHRNTNFRGEVTEVLAGLTKVAKTGNPQAVKLFLQYVEGWSEKVKVEDETSERQFTPDETSAIDHALKNIGLASIITKNSEK